ncbi:MAG: bifunctional DedA family/phosphatase PAP2 family protein [bacterium]|nr:bifunctional DedA family/phosphatase PAP2 family protein [bacterium]
MSLFSDFLLNLPLPLVDHWGYLLVFLSALVEALPVIGSFYPGQTAVILSGWFAQLEILRLDATIFVASTGAIIGDLLGYIIGRRWGDEFISRYGKYFFFDKNKYEKTGQLVREHAGKSLIIGRFSPFTRAFAPFIAGASRVKFYKFIAYDILGGITWAAGSILIGYIFGLGFSTAAKYFGRIIMIAVVAIILLVSAYRYFDRKKHIFLKNHLIFLVLNAISIYAFSKMAEDYLDQESTYWLDLWLAQRISSIWLPWLNKLMVLITAVFSPEVLLSIAVLAAAYYFIKKCWYRAALVFLSAAGGAALGAAMKLLIARPRPAGGLVSETGFSFPSNHALMAMIFFYLLILLFGEKINKFWLKNLFIAMGLTLILLTGFSRIYLKVHYFSDVLAGFALGLFWLTLLILLFRIGFKLWGNHPWIKK